MKKIILTVLVISLVVAAAGLLFANGSQESSIYGQGQGQGQGLRDGSGRGAGGGMGGGRGNGAGQSAAGNGAGGAYGYEEGFAGDMQVLLNATEKESVDAAEADALAYMREEEKLARDVYLALYETWNIPVFNNIARSEAQHMDSIKLLLDRYGLEDPAADSAPGVFENPELQKLYDSLTEEGRSSIVAALNIGATIEDLDIKDLQDALAESDNKDIGILYQNLMKGSRNHLRSFLRQLDRENESYEAQFISQDYLEKVININQETAPIEDPDYVF